MIRTTRTAITRSSPGITSMKPPASHSCPKARRGFRKWRRPAPPPMRSTKSGSKPSGATPTTSAIESIMDYNPEPDLDKIRAKVLLINDSEDVANPPTLGTVERAMQKVKDGRSVLIPPGANTHGHFTHYYAAVWKPYLIELMKSLGPAKSAEAN